MKQFFGMSQRGNLAEAARGLSNPEFIMLISNSSQFEQHVAELEKLFPKVPSIGCIGMGYDTRVTEDGVSIIAHTDGVEAVACKIHTAHGAGYAQNQGIRGQYYMY